MAMAFPPLPETFDAPADLPEKGSYKFMAGDEEKKTSKEFTGEAKAEYDTGDKYEGSYVDGKRHGKGLYAYYNSIPDPAGDPGSDAKITYYNFFQGTFKENVKTGLGRMTFKDDKTGQPLDPYHSFYHGHFLNGKRHGEGTFKYKNGDMYSGMWKEGKKHGQGTYVYAKTKYEITGIWKDGQITKGEWRLTDGSKYVGGFKNQKPCGDGIWQMSKGTTVEGAYIQWVVPVDPGAGKKAAPPSKDGKPPMQTKILWQSANPATLVATEE